MHSETNTKPRHWLARPVAMIIVAAMLPVLPGCGRNLDSAMWECQLEVQKGNAGKSADAAAERARDITGCMESRGYRLETTQASCAVGSVSSSCYRVPK